MVSATINSGLSIGIYDETLTVALKSYGAAKFAFLGVGFRSTTYIDSQKATQKIRAESNTFLSKLELLASTGEVLISSTAQSWKQLFKKLTTKSTDLKIEMADANLKALCSK